MANFNQPTTRMAILPSNWDKTGLYPKNRPSSYVTQLIEPWELPGEWEASIIDISYPATWRNITETFVTEVTCWIKKPESKGMMGTIRIPKGTYKTPKELMDYITPQINKVFTRMGSYARFFYEYDQRTKESKMYTRDAKIYIKADKKNPIFPSLGFTPATEDELKEFKKDADKDFDSANAMEIVNHCDDAVPRLYYVNYYLLQDGVELVGKHTSEIKPFNHMYVYTDVIQDTNVGGTRAQVFGLAPIYSAEMDTQILYTFPISTWIPVNRQKIDTIQIHIADDEGNEIIFESGVVIVRMIVRRKNSLV
jgi:hypothetical protein